MPGVSWPLGRFSWGNESVEQVNYFMNEIKYGTTKKLLFGLTRILCVSLRSYLCDHDSPVVAPDLMEAQHINYHTLRYLGDWTLFLIMVHCSDSDKCKNLELPFQGWHFVLFVMQNFTSLVAYIMMRITLLIRIIVINVMRRHSILSKLVNHHAFWHHSIWTIRLMV